MLKFPIVDRYYILTLMNENPPVIPRLEQHTDMINYLLDSGSQVEFDARLARLKQASHGRHLKFLDQVVDDNFMKMVRLRWVEKT